MTTLATEPLLTAAEWADMMLHPVRDQRYRSTRLGGDVEDYLAWKRLSGASPATLDQYERDIARACVLRPHKGLAELVPEDLLHILESFRPASRRRARAALNGMFRWAEAWGKIERNPLDRMPRPLPEPQRVVEVFTDAEQALLAGLAELRDRVLMLILLDAGLRKAEARHLRLEHVDLRQRHLVVWHGKGGKDRVVPLSHRLTGALAELELVDAVAPEQHLWYARRSNGSYVRIERRRPIGEASFHRWWERCLAEAGVRYRNPHTTRHTMATTWLRRGGRVGTLSKALGHSSIATTVDLYGHLDLRDVAADLELVEAGLKGDE